MLNFPVRASVTPAAIRRPAPLLGEHTAEILGEIGWRRPRSSASPPRRDRAGATREELMPSSR